MTETIHKGKIFSFWQFLSENRIEIPIIQRDYAQGRSDEYEIRENFLTALYNSLYALKPIKLDFIYGSVENGVLQPLDGQQRLTTLFLLHWYAIIRENSISDATKNILLNFTYETRISSREFCSALIKNAIILDENTQTIRNSIVDSSWFVLSWEKDPTIDAMLTTIDAIHLKFNQIKNLWEKLTMSDCLISFYHVELKNIGLTDDLYIKMNARGKLLSPFENFKASFQKYINENLWEINIPFINTFACQIDTIWTDLLWSHRKGDSIDEAFMRFTSAIVMIRQAIERSENRISTIATLQENPDLLKPEYVSGKGFEYLKTCFNIYSNLSDQNQILELDFHLWQHKPDGNIFSALVYEDNTSSTLQKNSASYTQKVLFFAQTEYLRKATNFNSIHFQDWMRVIRNIVSRGDITKYGDRPTIIRSPQTFDGVIHLINELSEGCENILKHLTEISSIRSLFAKEQVEEEILKARLITLYPDCKQLIKRLEDNNLLRGRISFALYCIDFENNVELINLELLEKVEKVFALYFNKETEIPNEVRRALLTIEEAGEYKFYTYWWSFWNVVSANKRCLIDKYRELEYYFYSNHKGYFKKLVLKLVDSNFSQIINDFIPPQDMPNWKIRLIKENDLLDIYCKSNYIAIPEDESCCYLLKSMRPRDLNGCEKIE